MYSGRVEGGTIGPGSSTMRVGVDGGAIEQPP